MIRSLALGLVSFLVIAGGEESGAGPRDLPTATALAVQRWVAAVNTHTPGRADEAVAAIHAMSFDARRVLNAGLGLFIAALKAERVAYSGDAARHIAEMGRTARQKPGRDEFLQRATVLHSDAAVFTDAATFQAGIPPNQPARANTDDPLLSNYRLTLDKDGEILGSVAADWNWPFARSLLDLLSQPSRDPFVGTWYHATLAFMLGNGLYGEATPHLHRAAEQLPDDARILFDRACYAEILGLPKTQVLLSDADVVALNTRRNGGHVARLMAAGPAQLGIPLADVTNDEAERLFRRALRADPSFVEARVRLARLLEVRKHYDEAATELSTALDSEPTGHVAFYAHLFAGRAAQALRRLDDAAGHYKAAAALFPGAQSALLGLSQVALRAADVPSALAPIEHLDRSLTARDPWWLYDRGAGRDADALLGELWASVPKV